MAFLAPFIEIANKITRGLQLQGTVQYEHCIGADEFGPLYAPAVPLMCIIDEKNQQVRTAGGVLSASKGQLTFLDRAALLAATGVDQQIRDIDVITMPDGRVAPILATGGFVDVTQRPVAPDVWLG